MHFWNFMSLFCFFSCFSFHFMFFLFSLFFIIFLSFSCFFVFVLFCLHFFLDSYLFLCFQFFFIYSAFTVIYFLHIVSNILDMPSKYLANKIEFAVSGIVREIKPDCNLDVLTVIKKFVNISKFQVLYV